MRQFLEVNKCNVSPLLRKPGEQREGRDGFSPGSSPGFPQKNEFFDVLDATGATSGRIAGMP